MKAIDILKNADACATGRYNRILSSLGPEGEVARRLLMAEKGGRRLRSKMGQTAHHRCDAGPLTSLCRALEEHSREIEVNYGWLKDPNDEKGFSVL